MALPRPPTHLLTVREYKDLGEDEHGRTELMEGNLVMSPNPTPDHSVAAFMVATQLRPRLPEDLGVLLDVDVDLQLVPPEGPGTSRRPDVLVVSRTARARVRAEEGLLRASEVRVAVEVASPGSKRIDNVVKRAEYADAGIPHYWIVDIDPPVSLHACHLTDEFGYVDDGTVTGTFTTDEPFPVHIDLDQLR